jgi:TM2 domain-containing membrane protein YozV
MKDNKDSNYAFNAKLISLAICIVSIIILGFAEMYNLCIIIGLTEIILWINLTMQEIKINLLKDIINKLEK